MQYLTNEEFKSQNPDLYQECLDFVNYYRPEILKQIRDKILKPVNDRDTRKEIFKQYREEIVNHKNSINESNG